MPWEQTENEIRERIQEPSQFQPDSFRRKDIGNGISLIIGKKKGSSTIETQAIRFDKSKWSLDKAQAWLKEHPSVRKQERYRGEVKSHELIHDLIDKYVRWKKRPMSDFENQTVTEYQVDEQVKALIGRHIGDSNFAVQCYLFPKEWEDNKIKKWLMANESRMKIRVEKA